MARPIASLPGDDIGPLIDDAVRRNAIPGVATAVMKAGVQLYARSAGRANLETGTSMSPDAILRIGSLTKQFVAAAVIRLAMLGKLDLSAPVSRYLPAFSKLPPFSLLEAMHQTAGLHSDESEEAIAAPAPARTQLALAAEIAGQAKPFDFPPGTAWLYSNANYIVLGAVIEQVMAMPLATAMERLVFEPLGLRHTAFDNAEEVVPGRASGYSATQTGVPPFANAAWLDPSQTGGAGAMRSTVGDLCKWHDLLLGDRLLDRTHTRLMLTPGRLRDGRLSSANRFPPQDANYGDYGDTEYACGLLVSGPSQPHPNILHYGFINGFSAVLQTWIGPRVTFASLCNVDVGPGVPFSGIRKAVVARWVGA
ncbi:serine hydrolase domain-containing protein [Sphingomonas sp.]|uniref:serine hydrolase domain-containing protein n=1 Tax=Sphingomonas sp. TaxID=28214 RepID=UPI001EC86198|nr:serine hydrolase domain-containing protein [Sphingomonas sp.]MBX3595593.1 beta-lactamase family protein [Sphingomonas sp.]